MIAMETDNQHDTYDTIKDQSLSTLLGKLTTKMPTAGETEKSMLATLWENEVDEDEALDVDQANRIDAQLKRKLKQLLKHLDGEKPKPPLGWQDLASAALGAALAQLDGVPETGARVSDSLAPAAEQRDGLREGGRKAAATLQEEGGRMDLMVAELLHLRAETASQKRNIDALTEANKKSTADQRVSNATLTLAEMRPPEYEQVKHSRDSRDCKDSKDSKALSTAWRTHCSIKING